MHIAAEQDRRDICVMLVAAGANLEARNNNGYTPMMVAFNKNHTEIATYLESKQKNIEQIFKTNKRNMKLIS